MPNDVAASEVVENNLKTRHTLFRHQTRRSQQSRVTRRNRLQPTTRNQRRRTILPKRTQRIRHNLKCNPHIQQVLQDTINIMANNHQLIQVRIQIFFTQKIEPKELNN